MARKTQQRKQLQSQLAAATDSLKALESERDVIDRRIQEADRMRHNLLKSLEALRSNNKEVIVSEHAILRYVERVQGCDIDALRDSVLPPAERRAAARLTGHATVPVGDSHRVVIRDGVVTTVLT